MPSTAAVRKLKWAFASGMLGWSILTNLVIVMIPFFYLPPPDENSGLQQLVPQLVWFGVINLLAIIISAGRLVDAIYDPLLAKWSDGLEHRWGRRVPFLRFSMIPAAFFCVLAFYSPDKGPTIANAIWLCAVLILFFVAATSYIIPLNALLPEVARSQEDKVNLAVFQQLGFVGGMILSALTNNFAVLIQDAFGIVDYANAVRFTVIILAVLALIFLAVPAWVINEKKLSRSKPSHVPLLSAIRQVFGLANFRNYLIADFCFYTSLSIISSGLLYFLTILAGVDKSEGGRMIGAMVIGSLFFYPFIQRFALRFGKKPLVITAFGVLSLTFSLVYFIGKMPFTGMVQMYILVATASFPLAALGILPTAILADIVTKDAAKTGEDREALFYAVKFFFVKMGQTLGIAIFAMLTIYGIKKGNDLGLRLNGVCGFILCVVAGLVFSRYREK